MKTRQKLHLILHCLAGALLCLMGYLLRRVPDFNLFWDGLARPLIAAGLALPFLAGFYPREAFARLTARLSLSISALILLTLLAEGVFRVVRFDFRLQEQAWKRLPPFVRRPLVPMGGALFRRAGPEQWTGQVLRSYTAFQRLPTDAYDHEPVVTVRYDQYGFRNEPRPTRWELAVAGDSFVELGFLPYDDLFTTLLGRRLNRSVLNLGVSYTGPLSYVSFLEEFGVCSALRDVVVVFYGGNDVEDLMREEAAERFYQRSGQRQPFRFRPQTSLLRACGEGLRRWRLGPLSAPPVTAVFPTRGGDVPVTLGPAPTPRAALTGETARALGDFFARYAKFGHEHRARLWLAFMPCKRRVLYGLVKFTESTPEGMKKWAPDDLPAFFQERCSEHSIRFIDLTPALVQTTRATQELMYNPRFDLHLNARGAAVVADVLAKRIRESAD